MSQRYTIPSLQGIPKTFGTKRSKPTLQPIVAISEGKQNLFWICRTEQQSAKLNFSKEPFSPSRSNPKTADAQETKNSTLIEVKCLIMNKAQHTTRYIKHLAESANFKGGTFNKHSNGLIGNRLLIPHDTIHSTPSCTLRE